MKTKKKKIIQLDDLAVMVKDGFDQVDKRFDQVDKRFDQVDKQFNHLEKVVDTLEKGQEEIKLRLDNVAYCFELVELQKRVEILEKKISFK